MTTVAWLLCVVFALFGFAVGIILGGFLEWDRFYPENKRLRSDLRLAYEESENLREILYSTVALSRSSSNKPSRSVRG
jgi:hypothetical protein